MERANWLTLNGELANVLETPVGINRETGEQYGGKLQVQVECWKLLRNGMWRKDIQTLSVSNARDVEP